MGYRLWGYKYRSPVAITITQHILLWGSLCALIVAMNVLSVAYMDITLRPTAILMLISSLLSFGYLAFHNITARRKMLGFEDEESSSHMKRPSYIATRILIAVCTMWLITSGGNFIVAARQPVCLPTGLIYAYWQSGGPCVAQRAGTAIAILIL
ncbi:hypothetical protein EJ08DRAFT_5161 [Tothia fuscella]|uniref:Uncharacterized protein n=1 Tax=Tothia fuscella TaxID=1048955 RepID=A0A9P4P3Y3_9PEZI|nr:hypothetical protein EJ08DRAFT_5161 [Tothia fuscella]